MSLNFDRALEEADLAMTEAMTEVTLFARDRKAIGSATAALQRAIFCRDVAVAFIMHAENLLGTLPKEEVPEVLPSAHKKGGAS